MTALPVRAPAHVPRTHRRGIVRGLAAGAAGTVLAACRLGMPEQQAQRPPTAVKFPDSLLVITIHDFSKDAGFNAAVEEFSARNKVRIELTPGSVQQVLTMIAGGTPPDVFRRDAAAFHQLVADGGLLDLTPYFQKSKDLKLSEYFPHLVRMQTYQGKLVAVPEDFQPASTLYYNKSIFEKAGEHFPVPEWPWDRLLEVARRLTRGTGEIMDQYGYYFPAWTWDRFVYNHGGQVVDNVENPTKCLLDSPEALAGLQFMVDLQHKWQVMPSPQVRRAANIPNEYLWFRQGRLATVSQGTWATDQWRQEGESLAWGLTLDPKGQDGKWHYPTGGSGWAIPREAKTPDASWEFIKWQFGPEGWRIWLSKRDPRVFWLPALQGLAAEEARRLEGIYPNASIVVRSAEYIYIRPMGARWERAMSEVLGPLLNDLHENKVAVRSAITEAVPRINRILTG
jgi:ABC-type glycerol-3-phosphate transport system substrate-binding protein